jgi:hypothetical protein
VNFERQSSTVVCYTGLPEQGVHVLRLFTNVSIV